MNSLQTVTKPAPMKLLPLALALLLAACGADETPTNPVDMLERVPGSQASVERSVAFTCEGDMPITALYGTDADGNEELALIISGTDYRLKPTEAPSGKRYASPIGAERDRGIIWWEDGEEALLQQAPSDQVEDPAAGVTARKCKIKTEPDPVPEGTLGDAMGAG